MKNKCLKIMGVVAAVFIIAGIIPGCSIRSGDLGEGRTIRILSGSENKELEGILRECEKKTGINIEMTYKGSVDIMHILKSGAAEYDAVWPASGIWISLGDTEHLVKHDESISTTPVVFGIKQSIASKLGLKGKEVSVKDILEIIRRKELSFCMTSATQSNSGASAYIGFLYALLDKKEALTEADLADENLKKNISDLLSGVDRSSGSSDWLKDMFLTGDFDAMVNYECLIIDANKKLLEAGKEPLYVVYPYDGLSLADSPLGYVDHGNKKKEEAFLKVQEYLLSDDVQKQIEATGRRIGYRGVSDENRNVFKAEWGIDADRILSPITMPSEKVLMKALNLYQTSFRKPSLNVYCLDFSGSMSGKGRDQLIEAMAQVILQDNARTNLLQAEEDDVNIIITFDSDINNIYVLEDTDDGEFENLYHQLEKEKAGGGTNMYVAASKGLQMIADSYDVRNYTPAIILMTDGESQAYDKEKFADLYNRLGMDVPVFSIMFGTASSTQLDELARLSNAKVFDGRKDLVSAFRNVKGYN
ncbi:MAG: substrate-binding domain-containing protein [Bacteroides sp.]